MSSNGILSAAVVMVTLIATPALAASGHKVQASHTYASQTQPDAANTIIGWDGRILGTDPDQTFASN